MITLRCTRRALQRLKKTAEPDIATGTSALGDWYVNVIGTAGGPFFLFTNERSLLSVTVPEGRGMVLPLFVLRVANLLAMLDVPHEIIEREIEHFGEFQFGKTQHRSIWVL